MVIRFARERGSAAAAVVLDPMSVPALVGMVFTDGPGGPTADELLTAARHSDGLPGRFLSRLDGAFPPSGEWLRRA